LRIILKVVIVCSCKGVPCRKIRQAVRDGAVCLKSIRKVCGAGGVCGQCRFHVAEILAEERQSGSAPHALPADLLQVTAAS
jgi:bacterioferritin-associated ferredoxin